MSIRVVGAETEQGSPVPRRYVLAGGIALAAAVMSPWLVVSPDDHRGVPGSLAVLAACIAAFWGGPTVGAVVALAAGAMFAWVLDQNDHAFTDGVTSGALWAITAIGIGVLAARLRRAQALADRLLRTDPLTGLLNRRALDEALPIKLLRSERDQRPAALVLLDVDRFKEINDSYGHHPGDRVLVELGRRLSSTTRATDSLARWGGDEFCVLLPGVTGEHALRATCSKLAAAVTRSPMGVDGQAHSVEISIGGVVLEPGRWDPASALEAADLALYAAKQQSGDDRVRLFSDLGPEIRATLRPEPIGWARATGY